MWQNPKTDWDEDSFLNFEDINRVESNSRFLADLLAIKFPPAPDITTVTDRTMFNIDFADTFNRVEKNIDILRQAFFTPPDWQPIKTDWAAGKAFTWKDIQRLESNLARLHHFITVSDRYTPYCGTLYAGQDVNTL